MTDEEAREVLGDVRAYLASRASLENEMLAGHTFTDICNAIKTLEIELLTDKEQRIFLKAINREREVCQKVDDEYSDNDSRVSLVKVCNSIERKVKKIWE